MDRQIGPRIHPWAALGIAGLACLAGLSGCRAVLGIHDDGRDVASADAGEEAEVDAGRTAVNPFCAAQSLPLPPPRCADFEQGDLFAGWDNQGQTPNPGLVGGGTFEELLATDGRKLAARTPPIVAADQHASAVLLYTMPSLAKNIGLRARLTVMTEEIPGPTTIVLMSIAFGDEGAVVVYRDREGTAIAVVPDGKAARFPTWPVGVARTVVLAVATGAKPSAQASLDGDAGPELVLPAHFSNARTRRVMLGPSVDGPMGEVKVSLDDVMVY